MKVFVAAGLIVYVSLISTTVARAETMTLCEQKVEYTLMPPAPGLPLEMSGFSGRWQGAVSYQMTVEMCLGFVFERVGSPGATGKRAWSGAAGTGFVGVNALGVENWSARWDGNTLRRASNDGQHVWELRMTGANEISGFYTNQGNRRPVWLKRL